MPRPKKPHWSADLKMSGYGNEPAHVVGPPLGFTPLTPSTGLVMSPRSESRAARFAALSVEIKSWGDVGMSPEKLVKVREWQQLKAELEKTAQPEPQAPDKP